jgi:protein-S-isoprenylcysteine O-methyltransferase Ste14
MSMTLSIPTTSAVPSVGRRRLILLDVFERSLIVALFAWLMVRMLSSLGGGHDAANLLMLLSEGLVVFFILIRRSATQVSSRVLEWLLALAATSVPLLVQPGVGRSLMPVSIAAALLLMGMLVQVHAKLVLGRSLGCVPANRGLKLSGPYRFVRHPMYAGYLLSHLVFLAMNPLVWNLAVYIVCYALQIPRLLAEERLLSQEDRYADYMRVVRYRLFPGVF